MKCAECMSLAAPPCCVCCVKIPLSSHLSACKILPRECCTECVYLQEYDVCDHCVFQLPAVTARVQDCKASICSHSFLCEKWAFFPAVIRDICGP